MKKEKEEKMEKFCSLCIFFMSLNFFTGMRCRGKVEMGDSYDYIMYNFCNYNCT